MSSITIQLNQLIEHLKQLHYPQSNQLTQTSFKQYNFKQTQSILNYLLYKLDKNISINNDAVGHEQRVSYLQSIASIFYAQLKIKLNLKLLYKSDIFVVKELLKITKILIAAQKLSYNNKMSSNINSANLQSVSTQFMSDMSTGHELSTELINTGEKLDKLLEYESNEYSHKRSDIINIIASLNTLSTNECIQLLHRNIIDYIQYKRVQINEVSMKLNELRSTIKNNHEKYTKKMIEYTRLEKRLDTLKKLRPSYLTEYNTIELSIRELYHEYIDKYKLLQSINYELKQNKQYIDEKKMESDKHIERMRNKIRPEQLQQLRGERHINTDDVVYRKSNNINDEDNDDVFNSDSEVSDNNDDDVDNNDINTSKSNKHVTMADNSDNVASDDDNTNQSIKPVRAATGRYKTTTTANDSTSDSEEDENVNDQNVVEDDDYF